MAVASFDDIAGVQAPSGQASIDDVLEVVRPAAAAPAPAAHVASFDDVLSVQGTPPPTAPPPAAMPHTAAYAEQRAAALKAQEPLDAVGLNPANFKPVPSHGAPVPVAARPAPIAVHGFTTQSTVTEPAPPVPWVNPATKATSIGPLPGPATVVQPAQVYGSAGAYAAAQPYRTDLPKPEDTPIVGSAVRGVERVLHAGQPDANEPFDPVKAANEMVSGLLQTAQPLVAGALVADPVPTALAIVKATLAGKFGAKGVEALGGTPELQELTANVAALLSGTVDTQKFVDRATRNAIEVAQKAARPLVITTQLGKSGFGVGDVPGYRGAGFGEAPPAQPSTTVSEPAGRTSDVQQLLDELTHAQGARAQEILGILEQHATELEKISAARGGSPAAEPPAAAPDATPEPVAPSPQPEAPAAEPPAPAGEHTADVTDIVSVQTPAPPAAPDTAEPSAPPVEAGPVDKPVETVENGPEAQPHVTPSAQDAAARARGMTPEDFRAALDEQPITIPPTVTEQDWGTLRGRGQGKRSGGMVKGAMSDVTLQGKKRYSNPFGNLPEAQTDGDARTELSGLDGFQAAAYMRARSFGLSHDDAMRYVYEVRGEAEPGTTHTSVTANPPPAQPADPQRAALIDRIVAATRKPDPTVVPSVELEASNGKWYSGHGVPVGVTLTGKQRVAGYVVQGADGVTYGTREPTAEAVLERHRTQQDAAAQDMRAALESATPERLQSQAEYWLKHDAPVTATAPNVSPEDIPLGLAQRAHAGTSMVPEERAAGEQQGYVAHLQKVWTAALEHAKTPEQQRTLRAAFEDYRQGYVTRQKAMLEARSRVLSTMITGPSNFPTARNAKRSATYEKRLREFVEWDKTALRRLVQTVAPSEAPSVSADRPDAPDILQTKIAAAQAHQELMKAANAIVRSKATDEAKIARLVSELKVSPKTAAKILEPDFMGRKGFPDYELTNNAANIRRMQARIGSITTERARAPLTGTFAGGRVEENPDNNRLQIFYDQKPDEATRAKLKANGFKWARSEGAWQRQRTEHARAALSAVGITLEAPDVSPQAPPAGPEAVPQQPAGDSGAGAEAPGVGAQPQGERPASDSRERSRPRRAEREAGAIADLVERARAGGFTGDETALARELRDRLQLIKELDAAMADEGRTPQALLKAIVSYGGISLKRETSDTGEIRRLKEFRDSNGAFAGVRGVFPTTGGLPLDGIVEALGQEPRFQHITSINDLLEELEDAGHATREAEPADRLVRGLGGGAWWEHIGTATPTPEEEASDSVEHAGGDTSFDPTEFADHPSVSDVLDTGEVQPRLPEAGAVRDTNIETPKFEAPFSLEREAKKEPTKKDRNLWGDAAHAGERLGGTTLDASFLPGGRQFVEEDVVPTLTTAGRQLIQAADDVRAVFAPDSLPAGVLAAGVTSAEVAAHAQRTQRAQLVMADARAAFAKMARQADGGDAEAREAFLRFTDAMEGTGNIEDLPADQRAHAKIFRELLASRRRDVQRDTGRLQSYIRDYFPHEWAKPSAAKRILASIFRRRPLQGSKAFLKQRTIPTVRQGVERGLVPSTWNPAELVLSKLVEMDKFLMASRILRDYKDLNIARLVRANNPKKKPEGWVRYPESFGTVYGKPTIEISEGQDAELVEALENFAASIGSRVTTKAALRGGAWGLASRADNSVQRRIGATEGVLMHEIGHILDYTFQLGEKIGLAQADERKEEINFSETPSRVRRELIALADLRMSPEDAKQPSSYRTYVRKRPEQIANLVHAFLYAPRKAIAAAPNAYWALYNLAKDTPELKPLLEIQHTRGLRLGVRTVEQQLDHLPLIGHYYGPPDAVRILTNYLSPGLRGNLAFDAYRSTGNFINQVQLSISTYHGLLVGLTSIYSKQALAFQLASRGRLPEALKAQLQVPVAPILGLVEGHKDLKSFYTADANARTIDGLVGQVVAGGGGFGWDRFWQEDAPAKFWRQLQSVRGAAERGNYPGAAFRLGGVALRALPTAVELAMWPIMVGVVPRLKMAAYMDLVRLELPELGPVPAPSEVRRILGGAWESIDNRFGQLRYDNLFWNNMLKDGLMVAFRAVGFNVGTTREVLGALPAQLEQLGARLKPPVGAAGGDGRRPTRLVNTGTNAEGEPLYTREAEPLLHRRMAFVISMFLWHAIIGGMIHYLRTGKRPEMLKDYFFPGPEGDRWSLPDYVKDAIAFFRDVPSSSIDTVAAKGHPLNEFVYRTLKNEDFWGVEIHDPDHPALQQAAEIAKYVVGEIKPVAVGAIERDKSEGTSTLSKDVARFVGLQKAPATVTRTDAEQLLHDINQRRGGHSTLTQTQGSQREEKAGIRRDLRAGDVDSARAAAASGDLSKPMVQAAAREAQMTNLQRGFRALPLDDALRVYHAATPAERRDLRPWLGEKIQHAQPAPAQAAGLKARIAAALKLPVAGAAVPVGAKPVR